LCKQYSGLFEELYSKYKDKVRFGFTHYGSYVSNSAIATECAAKQGAFWQMHDAIFKLSIVPDTSYLFKMANDLNLDVVKFKRDFQEIELTSRINENLQKINSVGIYGTPTIVINNKLVYNSGSLDEIENLLNNEMNNIE
jgi:protein-disulfide isomerase